MFNRTSNLDKIKVIASKGNNYFGLIQNEKKQNGFQQLHCLIIDSDFKLVRQLQFEVPYPEKNFNYENWLLTDDADFILEGSYYSKEKSENRKRWDAYKLFVSSNGNSGAIEYAINTSNLILSSSAIAYDAINKKLVLAAFYTDNVSTKSGIIYASLGTAANDSLLMIRQPIGDATLTRMFAGEKFFFQYSFISMLFWRNLNFFLILFRKRVSKLSFVKKIPLYWRIWESEFNF